MNSIKEWWNGLAERERRTLGIGGAALAVIVLVFGIWLPSQQGVTEMEAEVRSSRQLLNWMQQSAAEVEALQGQGAQTPQRRSGDQALYALADESARQAGLGEAIREVSPSGENRVRVDLQGADFDKLVNWLASLRKEYGITAGPISVRQTDQPGRVNAQIVLEEQQA